METKKIGLWGADRLEAIKAGRLLARYSVTLQGASFYLTARQYARAQPILYALQRELNRASTKLFRLRRRYEACDAERERAIDGWYEEQKENTELRGRLKELDDHNKVLIKDNFRLMDHEEQLRRNEEHLRSELSRAKRQADEAAVASQNDDDPFNSLKLTVQERKYAAEFLKAFIPPKRTAPAKIYSRYRHTGHHSQPRRLDRLQEKLQSSDFVVGVHCHSNPPAQTKKGEIEIHQENGRFYLSIQYFDGSFGATVRADITAETEEHAKYTRHQISCLLGKS